MIARNVFLALTAAAMTAAWGASAPAGLITVPYYNDFSTDFADFTTGGGGTWTLDTASQLLNYALPSTGDGQRTALVTAGNLGGSPANASSFVMSTDFMINSSSNTNFGFRALSDYTADVRYNPGGTGSTAHGQMRLFGSGLDTATQGLFTSLALDTLYTMTLRGTYSSGTLNLEFSMTDGVSTTTVSRIDTSPATGQDFGIRNYGTAMNADYHNFALIPEPASVVLLALGLIAGVPLFGRRRRRSK